ncbi:MAG: class I SAM-dependent methyltransferase [Planctomycetota bacterium]
MLSRISIQNESTSTQIECPACRSVLETATSLEKLETAYGLYGLYHCNDCDLQFWYPRNTDSSQYQTEDVYNETVQLHNLGLWHWPFFKYFPANKGKLLDIGCADGSFLSQARKRGFDVFGIDFDKEAVAAVVNQRKIPAQACSLDVFASGTNCGRFDVITFFEVLEHQDDLCNFLEQVKRLTKSGGWIAGTVPNRDRFMLIREYQDYPPNHFIRFSKRALVHLLQTSGFSNVAVYEKGFRYVDLAVYLETHFLAGSAEVAKVYLKKKLLKANAAQARILALNGFEGRFGFGYQVLKAARLIRNAVLLVPAVVLNPILKPHLYFQAQVSR